MKLLKSRLMEEFVFVPGQNDVILGWDSGLSGLSGLDCSEERQELRLPLNVI